MNSWDGRLFWGTAPIISVNVVFLLFLVVECLWKRFSVGKTRLVWLCVTNSALLPSKALVDMRRGIFGALIEKTATKKWELGFSFLLRGRRMIFFLVLLKLSVVWGLVRLARLKFLIIYLLIQKFGKFCLNVQDFFFDNRHECSCIFVVWFRG